ncbi:MAG: SBBP repeat-containing protein [Bacteroidota bacterium]
MIPVFRVKLYLLFFIHVLGKAQNCPSFSTYFGGTQSDEIKGIAIDNDKNSYVLGNTYSTDLPITPGLINDSFSGNYDGFIAKLDSCGSLVWCTYTGGANFDSAEKIALTTDGNLVFCGYTSSIESFTTNGCFQPMNNGGYDCFISKINPSGHIIWSTLFGKSGGDFAFDIAVDALNNIIVGGTTTSAGLYTSSVSFQQNLKANTDAFIARFSPGGTLKWCTYYGGNNSEDIHVVTTDHNCNIIGAGGSFSTNLNTSAGAYQNLNEGSADGYIIKLDSNCTRIFSSYLGGSGVDDVWGVACDANSNIYLAGHTSSADFDTTSAAYQTTNKGLSDWYLTKWSPAGTLLVSTLFGGSLNDNLARMILSGSYEVTLIGKTESTDVPMLGTNNQQISGGNYDLLLAKFNTTSLTPVWTSYYGGAQDEEAFDLQSYHGSFLEFVGTTNSNDYPISASPYQATLNASSVDGAITKLSVGNLVTTGIKSNEKTQLIMATPNPFTDRIFLTGNGIQSIHCYDVSGQDLYPMLKTNDALILNTELLAKGVYLLFIVSDKEMISFKMIK